MADIDDEWFQNPSESNLTDFLDNIDFEEQYGNFIKLFVLVVCVIEFL